MLKAIIIIFLMIIVYACGIAIGRFIGKRSNINTAGTIYVNLDAGKDDPAFRCAVTPEFVELAFDADLIGLTRYVVFELKEDNLNENTGMR